MCSETGVKLGDIVCSSLFCASWPLKGGEKCINSATTWKFLDKRKNALFPLRNSSKAGSKGKCKKKSHEYIYSFLKYFIFESEKTKSKNVG